MSRFFRALRVGALCLLSACGGGEEMDSDAVSENSKATAAHSGSASRKAESYAPEIVHATPISIYIDYFMNLQSDCNGGVVKVVGEALQVAQRSADIWQQGCELDGPYEKRTLSWPMEVWLGDLEKDRYYLEKGSTVYEYLGVVWYEGTPEHSFGGQPMGRVACPDGYKPSDLNLYNDINAGLQTLVGAGSLRCSYDAAAHSPEKDKGEGNHCGVGEPINQSTGNHYQIETDFKASGFEVFLQRTYNSSGTGGGLFGSNWTSNFDKKVWALGGLRGETKALRPNGQTLQFLESQAGDTVLHPNGDIRDTLVRLTDANGRVIGWKYTTEDDSVERYDIKGRLTSITSRSGLKLSLYYKGSKLDYAEDNFGQRITFTIDTLGRVKQVKDPAQRIYKYGYDGNGNLTTITYPDGPDGKVLTHIYGEIEHTSGVVRPNALTGIKDEQNIRFTTIDYDADGWAIGSEHAGGVEKTELTYVTVEGGIATETQVKIDGAAPATYLSRVDNGVAAAFEVDKPCPANPTTKTQVWAYRGQPGFLEDFAGNLRSSYYDGRGNEERRLEEFIDGTTRETTFKWHTRWRLPTRMTRSNLKIEATYDPVSSGLATRTITDTAKGTKRQWLYKSDEFGRIKEEDGPRDDVNDVTTFTYYPAGHAYAGQMESIVRPLGQTTWFTEYDAMGNLLESKDANGQITQLRYDGRDRLTRIIRNGQEISLAYYDVGTLKSVTRLPSGKSVVYEYDKARRLTDIKLSDGSRVHYTLEAAGKNKRTDVYDANNKLVMTNSATFDELYHLATSTNSRQLITEFHPDRNGNVEEIVGPLGYKQTVLHDGLNLPKMILPATGGMVMIERDVADQIWKVTDANFYETSWDVDVLGNVKSLTLPAPDGVIASQTPDKAGNVKNAVDFRGIAETRDHDALGRLKSRSAGSSPAISFSYDNGANAIGRLSGMNDGSGSYSFGYDVDGHLSSVSREVDAIRIDVGFGYTNGNLTSVTYPSGRVVSYGHVGGYLRSAKVDGAVLVKNISQHPSGKVQGWTWASGATYKRSRTKDGLVGAYNLGAITQTLGYNDLDQLETITDSANAAHNQTFGHDLGGRVTSYKGRGAMGQPVDEGYKYDNNGNRKAHIVGGRENAYVYTQGTNALWFAPSPSPRAWSRPDNYSLSDGVGHVFMLDDYGRTVGVTNNGNTTSYLINGFNQRVTKTTSAGVKTHYVYGPMGELLAELNGAGQTIKEYIWLPTEDDGYSTLVGVSTSGGAVSYIFTDHLGTPRMAAKADGTALWRWVSDPFGGGAPMESGLSLNLRFAGQYFDQEHGYFYNWHRYYDPSTGRYISSDPVGLEGGVNTYGYAYASPLAAIDPDGLQFLDLTTFASTRRNTTLDEAVSRGAWTRSVTLPAAAVALVPSAAGVLGPAGSTACSVTRTWYFAGAEADAAWLELTFKDKLLYEIGQKTTSVFSRYAEMTPVQRGAAIVADNGWAKALMPEAAGVRLGLGETFSTGPTPAFRWLFPKVVGGAGIGAGLSGDSGP